MTYLNKRETDYLQGMLDAYGTDPVVLQLCDLLAKRAAPVADPAMRACWQSFAADIRRAISRRQNATDLVAYRRDWSCRTWMSWLDTELAGTPLRSRVVALLDRAGCGQAPSVAHEYLSLLGRRARVDLKHMLPTGTDAEGWVAFVRRHSDELTDAESFADLSYWMIARGYPSDATPAPSDLLVTKRCRFQAELQKLIPEPTATDAPSVDPSDSSVFDD